VDGQMRAMRISERGGRGGEVRGERRCKRSERRGWAQTGMSVLPKATPELLNARIEYRKSAGRRFLGPTPNFTALLEIFARED
jgi:hypothetical protein